MGSVDLHTRYLGLDLSSPLVASASPVTGNLASLQALQEAGAAAVVLSSLFEEQLERDERAIHQLFQGGMASFVAELADLPGLDEYNSGPASYLRLINEAKRSLAIPVIASLNGSANGQWARHARLVEEAGADALELNVYFLAASPEMTSDQVERQYLGLVKAVREAVSIPLAVKVGPDFSALAHMARRLVETGADGLVLFNRFLQPDIDLETLQVQAHLALSSPEDLRLPLRWIAILRSQVAVSLAATSGVHSAEDVVKLLLAGADVTMLASALMRHGPGYLRPIRQGLVDWLAGRGYRSVDQIQGILCQRNCPDPVAFERVGYLDMLITPIDRTGWIAPEGPGRDRPG